jgi:hypothetical protein
MDSYQWTATMTCGGLLQLAIQQIVVRQISPYQKCGTVQFFASHPVALFVESAASSKRHDRFLFITLDNLRPSY